MLLPLACTSPRFCCNCGSAWAALLHELRTPPPLARDRGGRTQKRNHMRGPRVDGDGDGGPRQQGRGRSWGAWRVRYKHVSSGNATSKEESEGTGKAKRVPRSHGWRKERRPSSVFFSHLLHSAWQHLKENCTFDTSLSIVESFEKSVSGQVGRGSQLFRAGIVYGPQKASIPSGSVPLPVFHESSAIAQSEPSG